MKQLAIGLAIALALALVVFAGAYSVLGDVHVAEGMGAIPLIGSHSITEMIERRSARAQLASGSARPIATLQGYSISWHLMVVYSALVVFGVTEGNGGVFGFVGGALAAIIPNGQNSLSSIIGILGLFIGLPIALLVGYLLGRWVAARSDRRAALAIIVGAALGAILTRAFDFLVVPEGEFPKVIGHAKTADFMAVQALATFVLFSASGLVGVWFGRRRRLAKYFQYLLSILPDETRRVLVGLAYDEAQSLRASKLKASAAASALQSKDTGAQYA